MNIEKKGAVAPLARRGFLTALGATALAAVTPSTAAAGYYCDSYNNCVAGVDASEFAFIYAQQETSQWCWAACISMLFSYYGYAVSQSRIVREAYGSIVNMPAQGITMSRAMNREWEDDNGEWFTSRVLRAYDAGAGVNTIDNAYIIGQLERDRPLIIGASGHATIVRSLTFRGGGGRNTQVYGGDLVDPMVGFRQMRRDELTPVPYGGLNYVVAIRVDPA